MKDIGTSVIAAPCQYALMRPSGLANADRAS